VAKQQSPNWLHDLLTKHVPDTMYEYQNDVYDAVVMLVIVLIHENITTPL